MFDDQDILENAGLYFTNIFSVHKHGEVEDDPRIINLIDLNVLKVYFSEREPTEAWGYPTQLDDLYFDEPQSISAYGKEMWVVIANPSTYYYQTQVQLVDATPKSIVESLATHGFYALFTIVYLALLAF